MLRQKQIPKEWDYRVDWHNGDAYGILCQKGTDNCQMHIVYRGPDLEKASLYDALGTLWLSQVPCEEAEAAFLSHIDTARYYPEWVSREVPCLSDVLLLPCWGSDSLIFIKRGDQAHYFGLIGDNLYFNDTNQCFSRREHEPWSIVFGYQDDFDKFSQNYLLDKR